MKVVILMGSPREDGNTAAMAQAYKEGAELSGHDVEIVNVGSMKINGCLSCEYCHGEGNGNCIQQDDMQKVYPVINEAEIIVFASPIYYFTMSAQIEAVIQRFYAVGFPKKLRGCAMLLSSASNHVYEAAKAQFNDLLAYGRLVPMGIVTAHGDENKSENLLAQIRGMGKNLG